MIDHRQAWYDAKLKSGRCADLLFRVIRTSSIARVDSTWWCLSFMEGVAYGLIPPSFFVTFRSASTRARSGFPIQEVALMLIDTRDKKIELRYASEIDCDDIDGLIDAIESINQTIGKAMSHRQRIEDVLIAKVKTHKTKVRRVQGETRSAIIEMPDKKQDSAALKSIAEDKKFRLIWPQLIRIQSYAIKMREFNKAISTTSDANWNEYRDRVKEALLPPTARPRVKIER